MRAGVPMVFDAHHHVVHDRLSSYDAPSVAAMLAEAPATWPDPAHRVVHISNGRRPALRRGQVSEQTSEQPNG